MMGLSELILTLYLFIFKIPLAGLGRWAQRPRPALLQRGWLSLTCPPSCSCWRCRPLTPCLAVSPSSSSQLPARSQCSSGWCSSTSCGLTLTEESKSPLSVSNSVFSWIAVSSATQQLIFTTIKKLIRKVPSRRIACFVKSLYQTVLEHQAPQDHSYRDIRIRRFYYCYRQLRGGLGLALNCYVKK